MCNVKAFHICQHPNGQHPHVQLVRHKERHQTGIRIHFLKNKPNPKSVLKSI